LDAIIPFLRAAPMRGFLAMLAMTAGLVTAMGSAHAERRMFIISSNADGYGVDRCLASGGPCGSPVATAYCKSREFRAALSYHKVDKDDITGAIPTSDGKNCQSGVCSDDFVAIECSR
jgi:hypothetical protein